MLNVLTALSGENLTVVAYLICIAAAFVCGIIAAAAASFRATPTKSFTAALVLLPAIVATVIMTVNGNLGTGVAVMGAFSLIRFRSVAGKAKDIVSIFLVMTAGLAAGAGYALAAVLFTVIVSAVSMILTLIPNKDERSLELRITVPETLNSTDAFTGVLDKYLASYKLIGVKTSNMGSLYKMKYRIVPRDNGKVRQMIDDLRCLNGNLEIAVLNAAERSEEL